MKNSKSVLLTLVIVTVFGAGTYIYSQKQTYQPNSMMKKIVPGSETTEQETIGSRYIPYSKVAYDATSGKRRVLYFYATWCPTCKQANEDFIANPNKIPEDMVVIRTNYNDPDTDQEEKELAKKYGITYQHTFVQIDAEGKEITKWNGGKIDELLTNIK